MSSTKRSSKPRKRFIKTGFFAMLARKVQEGLEKSDGNYRKESKHRQDTGKGS